MKFSTGINEKIRGKLSALRALATQVRHFSNGREVFEAYRKGLPLPAFHLKNGMILNHRRSDDSWSLYREIFIDQCYTRPGFYTPTPADCVLDCGANIGFFAIYLQSVAPGIRVHCFEPSSPTRKQLEQNLKANHLEDYVTLHPYAIFNSTGSLKLALSDFAGDASLVKAPDSERAEGMTYESVSTIPLGRALELINEGRPVDLLKVDVEGAEVEILEGAGSDVWPMIKRVALEYHNVIRPDARMRVEKVLRQHFRQVRAFPMTAGDELGVIEASN